MSENESFIDEVTEALRRDRMLRLWRRWGPWVIAGIAGVVAVAAGVTWRQQRQEAEAQAAGSALLEIVTEGDAAARAAALAAFEAGREGGPALAAKLLRAAALAEAGERDAALAVYDEIAAMGDPLYAELARFKALMLRAPDMSPAERAEAFGAFAYEGGPFRLLALEMRATAYLEAGDRASARADVDAILADPLATADLRQRATVLSVLVGPTDGS